MVSSNDVKRLYLQAILSRKMVSQPVAAKIWEKCVDAVKKVDPTLEIEYSDTRDGWNEWVNGINDQLDQLNLEFAHLTDEITGKEIYGIVNRKQDEVAQLATDYSAAEIAYFKNVIEQIMLAPNESYCVSSLAALREVNNLKSNMTKTQAEVVLGSFVAKGWLVKSRRGRYSLSTRTKLELGNYFKNTYPDEFIECTICMEMLTRGIACHTPHCKARLHDHCYKNYRRSKNKCPSCGESWSSDDKIAPVGEAAFKEGQDKGKRRTRRTAEDDEEEESQIDPSQSQIESQTQSQSTTQPSQTQPKRKGRRAVISDDEEMQVNEEEEQDVKPQKRKSRR
ncbi:hypothetical protein NM688_g406 [Phlebia brevispora]|uniref:Uncharacterized protein n=1 Tax=Phlebia brevispora TaxID=194682 RepID=A0ACC1TE35_9APHY|nr:hypothetical protein NM688_g406 [Phlebia brevispora]